MADNIKLDVVASNPSIKSFEDFDVQSGGKNELGRDAYKNATFTTTGEVSDARAAKKAELMGSSIGELQGEAKAAAQPGDTGKSSGTL